MKQVGGILLTLVGIGLVLLGLLFIVGSAGRGYRLAAAAVMLAAGAVATGFGVRWVKQARAASPDRLRAQILALAKREDGELSAAEIAAAFAEHAAQVDGVLEELQRQGICQQRHVKGTTYYVFAAMQPRLVVRRCEFCQAELALDEQLTECPRCGGTVDTRRETRAVSGDDLYSMD